MVTLGGIQYDVVAALVELKQSMKFLVFDAFCCGHPWAGLTKNSKRWR